MNATVPCPHSYGTFRFLLPLTGDDPCHERNIDLEAPLTEEEAVEHREFFASVFQDIIAFAERQKARAGQKPMLPMSGVWEEGKLDA